MSTTHVTACFPLTNSALLFRVAANVTFRLVRRSRISSKLSDEPRVETFSTSTLKDHLLNFFKKKKKNSKPFCTRGRGCFQQSSQMLKLWSGARSSAKLCSQTPHWPTLVKDLTTTATEKLPVVRSFLFSLPLFSMVPLCTAERTMGITAGSSRSSPT